MSAPLFEWQNLTPVSHGGAFYDFCDALEVHNGISPPEYGLGLEHALAAWAEYSKDALSIGKWFNNSL